MRIPGQGEADQQIVRGTVCPPNGLRYASQDGSHEGEVL
jgi:hypothetical protein